MSGSISSEFRVAVRSLLRSPGYSLAAILTLSLGMSGATLVFSAINAVLLRPLPVQAPDRIVAISTVGEMSFLQQEPLNYDNFEEVARYVPALGAVIAHRRVPQVLGNGPDARVALGESVSANYFDVLGVRLPAGRAFTSDDAERDVAVLSHLAWRQWHGGDPQILGREIALGGRRRTVIGIAPEGFTGLFRGISPEFWIPIEAARLSAADREDPDWWVHGRVGDGRLEEVRGQLAALARGLAERGPATQSGRSFRVEPLSEASVHPAVPKAVASGGAAAALAVALLLLLVATTNVANLTLARATLRQRDIAIRTAIGATRWRIVRTQLVEGSVVATLAALIALLVASWAGQALRIVKLPVGIGIDLNLSIDWRVAAFVAVLVLLTMVVLSVAPALRTSSVPVALVLAQAGRANARASSRWRSFFLFAQAAVAMVLIVLGGLAVRSLTSTTNVDPGFDVNNAIVASASPGLVQYERERALEFLNQSATRVRGLPGVESAGWVHPVPLSLNIRITRLRTPGQEAVPATSLPFVDAAMAWPGGFRALGVAVIEGRDFDERDRAGQPAVALVNRAFVEGFWPGRPAIGQRVAVGFPDTNEVEVVGILENFKNRTLGDSYRPMVVTAGPQDPMGWQGATLVVRQASQPATMASVVMAIRSVDTAVPVYDVQPLQTRIGGVMLLPRYAAGLFGSIGLLSLLLIAVGLFGTVAFWAHSRTRELGVRIALGSERRAIVGLVIGQTLLPVAIGAAAGLVIALVAANGLTILLTGISPQDPLTIVVAAALLGATALAAAAWPAWRASRLDPIEALRTD